MLLKITVFAFIFYIAILSISILITGFLFISLNGYKSRIERVIYKHTGYTLNVGSIRTKLSHYYLPEVIISDIKLTNPLDVKQQFAVKRLDVVFSYSSVWNLEPIFNRINIDGTDINLQYLTDGSIIFNGININHPDKKTIENTKNSPIDLEAWILKQELIQLSNINFTFDDQKNNIPVLKLNNITTTLTNNGSQHDFALKLDAPRKTESDVIIAKLSWVGGKVSNFESWDSATLKLQSYNYSDNLTGTLQQYLPNLGFLQKFNAQTALDAQIKDGKLQYFYANFDLKHFQYALAHNDTLLNFPKLGGNIRIDLVESNSYKLTASNLTIATPQGYILDNKNISGSYQVGKNGQLSLTDTNVKAFNNLLTMIPHTDGISLDGQIEVVKLDWFGKLFKPTDFRIYAKFHNLAIKSKKDSIPNINGINGDLNITKESGTCNLILSKSTLIFKPVFVMPYQFKHLDTQITWLINKDKSFVVNLGHTNLEMADFTGYLDGKYVYTPGTHGYLALKAHVYKILTAKVGDYLPVQIGKSVHEWLNQGLIGGYGQNANLDLHGEISDFPFTNGKGVFYIDADINNAKLRYVKDWPTLDNLMGKFKIRNQKIIIEADSGLVNGNKIEKALVTIPDMTADGAYLVADGVASGSTSRFMNYLQKTPINKLIGNLPDKITTTGNGRVELHLNVPFAKPEKTTVSGSYLMSNNSLEFTDLPVPPETNVTGKLYFTEHGVTIDKIQSTGLDSTLYLSANTDKSGIMHFKIDSPNLNYVSVSQEYVPFLSSIVDGSAATHISFEITKHGISNIKANSDLDGVAINIPKPLAKTKDEVSSLHFLMSNNNDSTFDLDFDYAKALFGNIALDKHGKIALAHLGLGTQDYIENTSNKPKILITANLRDTYAVEWITAINDLLEKPTNNKTNESMIESGSQTIAPPQPENSLYPLEVLLDTKNLYVGASNYHAANADILVNKNDAIFSLNNTQTNGYGVFNYAKHTISLHVNDFHFYESIKDLLDKKNTSNDEIPFAVSLNNTLVANPKLAPGTGEHLMAMSVESNDPNVNIPITQIDIARFWYENQLLGHFHVNLIPSGKNLLIESGSLLGSASQVHFSGTNYCMECSPKKSFVEMQSRWDINDFGKLMEHIGYKNTVANGKGTITASMQWSGRLQDFDITHTIASINMDLKDGKFLKIDTTSGILARVIGILNLQYLFSFSSLGVGQVFENGFYFSELKVRTYLINNKIDIKSLYLWGATATVNSSGIIDIQNNVINLYMSVTPHLSSSVAIGVGVVTLNPLIGVATYGAEELLGSPINKLFTFNFHITGSLQNPNIEQIGVSKQVVKNVNSAVGN